jgi:hypothetical protein
MFILHTAAFILEVNHVAHWQKTNHAAERGLGHHS